jgi:serine/threonine-protein kinase
MRTLGIIHRDLKPANLFCVRRSDGQLTIKVLDFGISKAVDPFGTADAGLTKTSTVMGTPLYMSPEQMKSTRNVDARTDIWALGIILFELLAGKPPFAGTTVMELAINVSNEVPPSLQSFRAVPSELEAVVRKCLEKDLSRRYSSVRELAEALLPFAPTRARAFVERISGILQPTESPASTLSFSGAGPGASSADPIAGAATISSMETQGGARTSRTALWAGAGAVGAVGVAALVWFLATTTTHGVASEATAATATPPAAEVPSSSATAVSPASIPPASIPPARSEPAAAPPPTATASSAAVAAPAVAPPSLKPRSTPRPATRVVDCDPPFTLNEAGHRVHKPGCQ